MCSSELDASFSVEEGVHFPRISKLGSPLCQRCINRLRLAELQRSSCCRPYRRRSWRALSCWREGIKFGFGSHQILFLVDLLHGWGEDNKGCVRIAPENECCCHFRDVEGVVFKLLLWPASMKSFTPQQKDLQTNGFLPLICSNFPWEYEM